MIRQSRSCGRASSWIVRAVSGLALLLSSSTAGASVLYPTSLHQFLDLDAVPNCVLCHTTEAGGAGTATKPFAQTLKSLGIEGGSNEATLKSAINKNVYDTDRDGIADVQELKDGSDPNVKDREVEPPPPATGGTNGSGTGGAGGDPGSPSGGTSGEGTTPDPGEAGSGSGGPPQNNQGGGGESSQEPEPGPSDPPPSLPPPPPPPPGGGQEIPLRETGCAFAAPALHSALAPALLLGAACALASRRHRRRDS